MVLIPNILVIYSDDGRDGGWKVLVMNAMW
jgi:hypothetical protein